MLLDACAIAPTSWNRYAIADVCERVTSGGTPSRTEKKYYEKGIVRWVKTKELNDGFIFDTEEKISEMGVTSSSAKILPENTILLAMYGATVGMLGILAEEMACNQACCALVPAASFDRDYLFFQLLAHREQIQGLAIGAAQQNLSGQQIKQFVLPFPELQEQRAIGAFLRSLDDRIALLRETNATLEAIAQALFKSWFVDFDPVRAKAQGRSPEGMDEAIAALFPDGFDEDAQGGIPLGWSECKIENFICRIPSGQKYEKKTVADYGCVPVVDQSKSGFMGFHSREPGVVATIDRPVVTFANHTCAMRLIPFSFSVIQNVIPFTGAEYDTIWTYLATKDKVSFSEYKGHWPDFSLERIILPPPALTFAFRRKIDSIYHRLWQGEAQIKTLTELRDTLLPRLISGQLRLPQAEAQAAEAGL